MIVTHCMHNCISLLRATELVDPLDVKKKLSDLEEKRSTLLAELDTQIKVSNATTFIEIA